MLSPLRKGQEVGSVDDSHFRIVLRYLHLELRSSSFLSKLGSARLMALGAVEMLHFIIPNHEPAEWGLLLSKFPP